MLANQFEITDFLGYGEELTVGGYYSGGEYDPEAPPSPPDPSGGNYYPQEPRPPAGAGDFTQYPNNSSMDINAYPPSSGPSKPLSEPQNNNSSKAEDQSQAYTPKGQRDTQESPSRGPDLPQSSLSAQASNTPDDQRAANSYPSGGQCGHTRCPYCTVQAVKLSRGGTGGTGGTVRTVRTGKIGTKSKVVHLWYCVGLFISFSPACPASCANPPISANVVRRILLQGISNAYAKGAGKELWLGPFSNNISANSVLCNVFNIAATEETTTRLKEKLSGAKTRQFLPSQEGSIREGETERGKEARRRKI
ncbi:hypothetical protein BJ166DRAFT_378556 [Pestalotiopsis sp. NC0098]|nr:hypothetical protein BJ166DRAFT_378556 [Pestalotiopsis sp. NC0098]